MSFPLKEGLRLIYFKFLIKTFGVEMSFPLKEGLRHWLGFGKILVHLV